MGNIDGYFGPITQEGIDDFKKDLKEEQINSTRYNLNEDDIKSRLTESIIEEQEKLKIEYPQISTDGIVDNQIIKILKSFQESSRLKITGRINGETHEALEVLKQKKDKAYSVISEQLFIGFDKLKNNMKNKPNDIINIITNITFNLIRLTPTMNINHSTSNSVNPVFIVIFFIVRGIISQKNNIKITGSNNIIGNNNTVENPPSKTVDPIQKKQLNIGNKIRAK